MLCYILVLFSEKKQHSQMCSWYIFSPCFVCLHLHSTNVLQLLLLLLSLCCSQFLLLQWQCLQRTHTHITQETADVGQSSYYIPGWAPEIGHFFYLLLHCINHRSFVAYLFIYLFIYLGEVADIRHNNRAPLRNNQLVQATIPESVLPPSILRGFGGFPYLTYVLEKTF